MTVDGAALRALLLDDGGRTVLFPAFETRLRSRPTSKNVRLGVDNTHVEIALDAATGDRTKISVAHSRLATTEEMTIWKQFWAEWLDSLDEAT